MDRKNVHLGRINSEPETFKHWNLYIYNLHDTFHITCRAQICSDVVLWAIQNYINGILKKKVWPLALNFIKKHWKWIHITLPIFCVNMSGPWSVPLQGPPVGFGSAASSLPTLQSRHVRPTRRLCLEDHVPPTDLWLFAGSQATTVTVMQGKGRE